MRSYRLPMNTTMATPVTSGIHHLGLTVSKLEESAQFFLALPGWKVVRRKPDYPAIFVSDGSVMLTLWAVKDQPGVEFDRRRNVGLHHVALRVNEAQDLESLHADLSRRGVEIEFAPQQLGDGPARHMMCYDPSGLRVEFTWPGK